jgi:hypothetical protein
MLKVRRVPGVVVLAVALAAVSGCFPDDGRLSSEEVLERAGQIEVELPPGRGPLELPEIREDMRYSQRSPEALVHDLVMCIWMEYWLERFEANDPAGMQEALEGVGGLQQWDIYFLHDHSYRDRIEEVVGAAEFGDASEMSSFVELNC